MTEAIICAPMRIEARAIRRGLRASSDPPWVIRTGYGTTRAADRAGELKASPFGQMVVMGVGAGLTDDLSPGDLVVGTEVGLATCLSAPLLAGELRRAGLTARTSRITTVDHLVRRSERAELAADGTLLADMESAPLAGAAGDRPVAVIRAVSDTPVHPVAGIVSGGLAALRALRAAAPVLRRRGPGHRDRRAGARTAGRARLRAQADRAQHPRGGRPRGPRRGVRGRARPGARRRHRGVLRARRVARGTHRGVPARAGGDRRDLPAGLQGARGGPAVRRGRVHGRADRPRGPRGSRGHPGRGTVLDGARADAGRRGRAAAARRGAHRLPDADHAVGRRGRGGVRRAARAVPRGAGPGQRRHLLRDDQPAGRGAGCRRRFRPGARGRLGELLQLGPVGGDLRAHRYAGAPDRQCGGHPARLAYGGKDDRLDRWSLRPSRRGGGDHFGALRARPPVRLRASDDHGINPVRPAQGGTALMPMPLRQSLRVGSYLMRQKLAGNKKFPLLVELEPLFACNLKCAGCGKIQQPHDILKQRMPVEQALGAIEESGAPMVSIAGGEPLMHPQIDVIVAKLIERKKFVFLCTNALLLPKKLDKFKPSPYFAWVVHIDGLRERHDESVCKEGVFDEAVAAIKLAKSRGFKVNTNTTFFNTDTPQTIIEVLTYLNDDLGIDEMQISPAYAYEKAPDQEHFLGVEETRELFRKAFADGRRKKWRLNHTPLFLDFLEGKTDFGCTAWGIPSYSLLGWQKPCYLMNDGYVKTYKELIETTDWDSYGRGKDPRCANCMAHCGYEPSAVLATMSSLRETIRAGRGNLSPLAGLAAAKAQTRDPRLCYRRGPRVSLSRALSSRDSLKPRCAQALQPGKRSPSRGNPAGSVQDAFRYQRQASEPARRSLPGRFTAPPSARRQSPLKECGMFFTYLRRELRRRMRQ